MQNQHIPEREEVYLEDQISIIASKKLHQNRKLAYNSFPSGACPETIKEDKQLSEDIFKYIYNNIIKQKGRTL